MKVETASFLYFVYPFLFAAEEFAERSESFRDARWPEVDKTERIWEPQPFPEEDLLAHVEHYLNSPEGTKPTAHLWRLSSRALQSNAGLGGGAQWRLTFPQGEVEFRIEAAQLALFRAGVGFITICAHPVSDETADWLDFLHYFRFARGQRRAGVRAERRVSRDEVKPFFPEAAGGLVAHPDGSGLVEEVIRALLRTGSGNGEASDWWSEVFVPGQLAPFAALFVCEAGEEESLNLVYRVRNFFHSRQALHPGAEGLRPDHPSLLQYASRQWFIFSLDGGAFVACDAPATQFFQHDLPRHLRDQYFLLFLLALHQRFALMSFSQRVSEHWLRDEAMERERVFERLCDGLLEFTARGYFAQVMQREHHHRCYRKWQETFQIERLFQEVSHEVREMHNYLLLKRTERLQQLAEEQRRHVELEARAQEVRAQKLEKRISLLGLIIGVPALVIGFLGINLAGYTANEGLSLRQAIIISAGGLIIGAALGLLVGWLSRK